MISWLTKTHPVTSGVPPRRLDRWLAEFSGAFGDLGTFLPYVLGALTIGGLAPQGLLLGFGLALIGAGLFFRAPVAVQPMKVVGAVLLAQGMTPGEVAAAGMMLGGLLLLLVATGALGRVVRWVPRPVILGLQLGLGLSMAWLGAGLMANPVWLGALALGCLLIFLRLPYCPAAPAALLVAILAGWTAGLSEPPAGLSPGWSLPTLTLPSWDEVVRAVGLAVLPQLPLTLANAVIVTAALAHELFPDRSARTGERHLALSTGITNLLLSPLGALPMCHGAGGLQAQYRYGARTGAAPVILGVILLALGLFFAGAAAAMLAFIPIAAGGALLLIAGADLALSRRLFNDLPVQWPVIGLTAVLTMAANPAVGLAGGWLAAAARGPLARAIQNRRTSAGR